MKRIFKTCLVCFAICLYLSGMAQQRNEKVVIAYYAGNAAALQNYDVTKITHIIYCFGHLKGNDFYLGNKADSLTVKNMVALKKVNPALKVLLSLGGWGGCKTCSDVFNTKQGRQQFVQSFKSVNDFFGTDGIDLDWEYPAVLGYPGHAFRPEDKENFTDLVLELRRELGQEKTITFAAGGYKNYLDSAINWKAVTPLVDYINLMTYDLVGGYSKTTGHHTPLYSAPGQKESVDNCVQILLTKGVPPEKLVVGAAFYARVWQNVDAKNNGLYNAGKFKNSVDYRKFSTELSTAGGYNFYWDDATQAPYAYNASEKLFATFDDKRSVSLKTEYVLNKKLGGIMFWQLPLDEYKNGLLDVIDKTLKHDEK